ncbi:hypothetical protein [Microvirga sp. Mcv34]|uniref:hypothetical protein n=1 Tax=Microvirga sp. Mcv34 TaxID=2926016 RepID=UPI0021C79552|nr:hypothetical protein [Microvirga sp. Mcv34]
MTKTLRPYDVTDTARFLQMESDNHPQEFGHWSILHNGDHVSLHGPDGGWIEIPRDQFNAIVDWYMAPQPLKGKDNAD